ncbi:MAG: ABC transporter permease subunit [Defluviitaleaceae bacterium]|nr:ABC transporter permease subunit [Defluviitaleaceae bacterium]
MQPKRKSFLGTIFRGLFFGQREVMSMMEEEQIQSPTRTIARNFFARKLTKIGLAFFTLMLLIVIILPFFFPLDEAFFDTTMGNRRPSFNMMRFPRALDNGNAAYISAGSGFGVGVTQAGNVHVWGQTGLTGLDQIPAPMGRVIQVSAGMDHALALNAHGQVFTWGNPNFNLPNIPPDIQGRTIYVAAGVQYSAALTDDGIVHVWGNDGVMRANINPRLQAGRPARHIVANITTVMLLLEDNTIMHLSPRQPAIGEFPDWIQGQIVDIALTDGTGAALLMDGTVVAWGDITAESIHVPDHIQGRVVEIDGGRWHFTAILDDGSLYSWGNNFFGQLNVPTISNAAYIFPGFHHNYVIDTNGNIRTWGLNGFLMGSDELGRDVFVRFLSAGRISMTVGVIAVIIAAFIGITLGGISGYFGGKIDMFLMRFSEIWGSIPFLPLAILLSHIIGRNLGQIGRLIVIMVVLGILTWPALFRLVRGQLLQARENEYVIAARALGVTELRIIFKHIFPNIISVISVWLALNLAGSMLTESTLSFIGFGVSEPTPSWGNMLTGANNTIVLRQFWWRWIFPAIALTTVTLSINIIGDGLREAIDPRAQER